MHCRGKECTKYYVAESDSVFGELARHGSALQLATTGVRDRRSEMNEGYATPEPVTSCATECRRGGSSIATSYARAFVSWTNAGNGQAAWRCVRSIASGAFHAKGASAGSLRSRDDVSRASLLRRRTCHRADGAARCRSPDRHPVRRTSRALRDSTRSMDSPSPVWQWALPQD